MQGPFVGTNPTDDSITSGLPVTQDFAPVPDIFTLQGPCKRAKRSEKAVRQEPRLRRLNAWITGTGLADFRLNDRIVVRVDFSGCMIPQHGLGRRATRIVEHSASR